MSEELFYNVKWTLVKIKFQLHWKIFINNLKYSKISFFIKDLPDIHEDVYSKL